MPCTVCGYWILNGLCLMHALFLIQYAISQLNKLEDSIWERWTRKKPQERSISMYLNTHTHTHTHTHLYIYISFLMLCSYVRLA